MYKKLILTAVLTGQLLAPFATVLAQTEETNVAPPETVEPVVNGENLITEPESSEEIETGTQLPDEKSWEVERELSSESLMETANISNDIEGELDNEALGNQEGEPSIDIISLSLNQQTYHPGDTAYLRLETTTQFINQTIWATARYEQPVETFGFEFNYDSEEQDDNGNFVYILKAIVPEDMRKGVLTISNLVGRVIDGEYLETYDFKQHGLAFSIEGNADDFDEPKILEVSIDKKQYQPGETIIAKVLVGEVSEIVKNQFSIKQIDINNETSNSGDTLHQFDLVSIEETETSKKLITFHYQLPEMILAGQYTVSYIRFEDSHGNMEWISDQINRGVELPVFEVIGDTKESVSKIVSFVTDKKTYALGDDIEIKIEVSNFINGYGFIHGLKKNPSFEKMDTLPNGNKLLSFKGKVELYYPNTKLSLVPTLYNSYHQRVDVNQLPEENYYVYINDNHTDLSDAKLIDLNLEKNIYDAGEIIKVSFTIESPVDLKSVHLNKKGFYLSDVYDLDFEESIKKNNDGTYLVDLVVDTNKYRGNKTYIYEGISISNIYGGGTYIALEEPLRITVRNTNEEHVQETPEIISMDYDKDTYFGGDKGTVTYRIKSKEGILIIMNTAYKGNYLIGENYECISESDEEQICKLDFVVEDVLQPTEVGVYSMFFDYYGNLVNMPKGVYKTTLVKPREIKELPKEEDTSSELSNNQYPAAPQERDEKKDLNSKHEEAISSNDKLKLTNSKELNNSAKAPVSEGVNATNKEQMDLLNNSDSPMEISSSETTSTQENVTKVTSNSNTQLPNTGETNTGKKILIGVIALVLGGFIWKSKRVTNQ